MKEALTKAIGEGYSPKLFGFMNGNFSHKNEVVWCDSLFWQALGKARGECDKSTPGHEGCPRLWLINWHRFIDHLAEGKSPDEFFTNLLK